MPLHLFNHLINFLGGFFKFRVHVEVLTLQPLQFIFELLFKQFGLLYCDSDILLYCLNSLVSDMGDHDFLIHFSFATTKNIPVLQNING